MLTVFQVLATCLGLLLQEQVARCIPLDEFFPFGSDAGDSELPSNDDGSTGPISLTLPFPFFASTHTMLFVSLCSVRSRL